MKSKPGAPTAISSATPPLMFPTAKENPNFSLGKPPVLKELAPAPPAVTAAVAIPAAPAE